MTFKYDRMDLHTDNWLAANWNGPFDVQFLTFKQINANHSPADKQSFYLYFRPFSFIHFVC